MLFPFLFLGSCSESTPKKEDNPGGVIAPPAKEWSGVICPLHETRVYKISGGGGIACYASDPLHGLTSEQMESQFPYAIWHYNYYRVDESPDTRFPFFYLVCDRCDKSWREFKGANPSKKSNRLEIVVSATGEITIHGTTFSLEQIPAVAKAAAPANSRPRLYLTAHKDTPVEMIRGIVKACEPAGFTDVIFGSVGIKEVE